MSAPLLETPFGDIMNVSQALAINMMRRADEVEAEPQTEMHQGMELPPAVVVGVEEEGFREEEQDVREERGREHAHQVVRELRIQNDEHERQAAPKVAVSEKDTERSFVNSCASRSYRKSPVL